MNDDHRSHAQRRAQRAERLATIFWAILSGAVIAAITGILAGAMLWGMVNALVGN